jgi:hypothetical protein
MSVEAAQAPEMDRRAAGYPDSRFVTAPAARRGVQEITR